MNSPTKPMKVDATFKKAQKHRPGGGETKDLAP